MSIYATQIIVLCYIGNTNSCQKHVKCASAKELELKNITRHMGLIEDSDKGDFIIKE